MVRPEAERDEMVLERCAELHFHSDRHTVLAELEGVQGALTGFRHEYAEQRPHALVAQLAPKHVKRPKGAIRLEALRHERAALGADAPITGQAQVEQARVVSDECADDGHRGNAKALNG